MTIIFQTVKKEEQFILEKSWKSQVLLTISMTAFWKVISSGSFEEQTHNLKRELPQKRTTPKLRFWKETVTLRKLQ